MLGDRTNRRRARGATERGAGHSVALAMGVLAGTFLCEHPGEAATCCGDPGALGQRVRDGEQAVATASIELGERLGSHAGDETFQSMNPGDFERSASVVLGWAVRLYESLELGVSVPLRVVGKELGERSDVAAGAGDLAARARFAALRAEATSLVPAVFPTATVIVPTGRPSWSSESALGADVLGQGVPELKLGVELEEYVAQYALIGASLGVGLLGARNAGGLVVERAPRLTFAVSAGPRLDTLGVAVGIEHEREAAPSIDGVVAERGRSRTSATVGGIYELTLHHAVTLSGRVGLPIDGAGQNELVTAQIAFGFRWAIFDDE